MTSHTAHFDRSVVKLAYLRAKCLHAGQCRRTVGARRKIREARNALGKRTEHGVAMADGLVAGKAQAAHDVTGRANDAFLRSGVQIVSESLSIQVYTKQGRALTAITSRAKR